MNKEEIWLLDEKYGGRQTEKFKKDLKRLQAGEPVDFVIGFKYFLGVRIDLSKRPLIPRPETEFWVGEAIKQIGNVFDDRQKRNLLILDIFSGSGCIGLAIVRHVKSARVVFADKVNKITARKIKFVKSDVLKNIKGKFDYIFANPPYIPAGGKSKIQKSVLKYEPKMALFGGKDGLFYIRKFLKEAKNHLEPGGQIFMEFSSEQKREVEEIIKQNNYKNYKFHKDQFNKWRWVEIF